MNPFFERLHEVDQRNLTRSQTGPILSTLNQNREEDANFLADNENVMEYLNALAFATNSRSKLLATKISKEPIDHEKMFEIMMDQTMQLMSGSELFVVSHAGGIRVRNISELEQTLKELKTLEHFTLRGVLLHSDGDKREFALTIDNRKAKSLFNSELMEVQKVFSNAVKSVLFQAKD